MTQSLGKKLAQIVWDYMCVYDEPQKSDAIIAFGSTDGRTAERAAELYLQGLAPKLLMSGGQGRFTKGDKQSEAERYKGVAIKLGVPAKDVLVENTSSNTGENIQFSYELLKKNGISANIITLVHKPYMQRRTYATFKKQWPNTSTKILVTAPKLTFNQYLDNDHTLDHVTNVMVGDLQRIIEYPKLGFQITQKIPDEVLQAYKQLIKIGYTKHLI